MNRYEIVMRQNVARNLSKFLLEGFPKDINKSDLTPAEKKLNYSTNQDAYAKVIADFVETAKAFPERNVLSEEARSIKRRTQDQKWLTGNEVGKIKNWDVARRDKNRIGAEKVAVIRDYLMSRNLFRKYHAVALNADERFHSVVDFASAGDGGDQDLQDRMRRCRLPDSERSLQGDFWLFRRSMTNPDKYVRLIVTFEFTAIGSCLYTIKGSVPRASASFDVRGEGFYLYQNECFVLTGRYDFVTPTGVVLSQIDHMVLYDDKNDNVLDGLWTASHTKRREPRCMGVALFSCEAYDRHRGLKATGPFDTLPVEFKDRVIEAEAYKTATN